MLPSENRLTKVRDFNLLLRKGYWVRGEQMSLKVLNLAENRNLFPKKEDPDKFEKQLKIAFSVGLKVSKKAIERNRLRRQLREVVRLLLKEGKLKKGYYLLFTPTPAIMEQDYAKISAEVGSLLIKGKVLNNVQK